MTVQGRCFLAKVMRSVFCVSVTSPILKHSTLCFLCFLYFLYPDFHSRFPLFRSVGDGFRKLQILQRMLKVGEVITHVVVFELTI